MAVPVPQYDYVRVYDAKTKKDGFENNGNAILCPSRCEILEVLNGNYSVTLEHPIDENGIWRNIQAYSILKVQGQLFTVMNAEPSYTGNSGKITVYAEHVFYKQNDEWIPPKKENSGGGWDDVYVSRANVFYALSSARDESFPNEYGESYFPEFSFDSDVETNTEYAEKIESGKTRCEEVFDLLSEYGGELYRNNFYYSINKRMENAKDNAFDIRIGLNLKGIKRTVDMSTFCTHFSAWDNFGNFFAISYDGTSLGNLPVPNIIARSANFTYAEEYESIAMKLLERDATAYFNENLAPKITYTVSIKDVRNNPDYVELSGFRYKVGDTGRVYDERLGGALTLKIIKTKTDGITGEVTEVTFGDVTDFIYESSKTPVPKFPVLPPEPKHYDSDKTALVLLDTTLNETDDVTYFTNLTEAKTYLDKHKSDSYNMYIGNDSGITYIPVRGFTDCANLNFVSFSDSITEIGDNAFWNCTRLKSVKIRSRSDNTIKIGGSSFRNTALEEIEIPERTVEIREYAFQDCKNLKNVKFSTTLPLNILYQAFSGCISLEEMNFPSKLGTIGAQAVANCTNLKAISVPDDSQNFSADNGVLFNKTKTEIVLYPPGKEDTVYEIPYGVADIAAYCFSNGCTSLNGIAIPDSVTNIGMWAFRSCSNLKTVTIPDSVVSIGIRAFSGCKSLESIVIGRNTETIPESFCEDCTSMIAVDIPENVKAIGRYAFSGCTGLSSVSIGSGAETMGTNAFYRCSSLTEIRINQPDGSISGAPWGATNATVIWTG